MEEIFVEVGRKAVGSMDHCDPLASFFSPPLLAIPQSSNIMGWGRKEKSLSMISAALSRILTVKVSGEQVA